MGKGQEFFWDLLFPVEHFVPQRDLPSYNRNIYILDGPGPNAILNEINDLQRNQSIKLAIFGHLIGELTRIWYDSFPHWPI